MASLHFVQGDITRIPADAIVNAANSSLAGGGGVDGAIHAAGGPAIMADLRRYDRCPTGDVVVTVAGNLPAQNVIHAVAPRWRGGGQGEPEKLASAYRRSLEVADELGARRVTFPSLGTGAYRYPVSEAARIALHTVMCYLNGATGIEDVTFVLFSPQDLQVYEDVYRELQGS